MTCAEVRRQLPGPEGMSRAAVEAHLVGCLPCRAEAEALREIDRRLQRLGAYQLLSTSSVVLSLDRQLEDQLGRPLSISSLAPLSVHSSPAETAPEEPSLEEVPGYSALRVDEAPQGVKRAGDLQPARSLRPPWLVPLLAFCLMLMLLLGAVTWVVLFRR